MSSDNRYFGWDYFTEGATAALFLGAAIREAERRWVAARDSRKIRKYERDAWDEKLIELRELVKLNAENGILNTKEVSRIENFAENFRVRFSHNIHHNLNNGASLLLEAADAFIDEKMSKVTHKFGEPRMPEDWHERLYHAKFWYLLGHRAMQRALFPDDVDVDAWWENDPYLSQIPPTDWSLTQKITNLVIDELDRQNEFSDLFPLL